jgi:hypothetical protein
MSTEHPAIDVAVIMRKERIKGDMSRWQTWRWVLDDVLMHETGFGEEPRMLYKDDDGERWLHPRYRVELFEDDAEGYQLNASTVAPGWFVLWRMQDPARPGDEPQARPVAVSLSYHDASRWLDAQETVEQIAAPPVIVDWLKSFIEVFHPVEAKRARRPQSFRLLADRFGNPVSISTEKKVAPGDASAPERQAREVVAGTGGDRG